MLRIDELLEGRYSDRRVRWYLRFKLSYRDLVDRLCKAGQSW